MSIFKSSEKILFSSLSKVELELRDLYAVGLENIFVLNKNEYLFHFCYVANMTTEVSYTHDSNEKKRHLKKDKRDKSSVCMYNIPKEKSEEKISEEIHNNWTQDNVNTVLKWQKDIGKSSFIYGRILEKKEFFMQFILIFTLILSVLITIFSGLSVALSSLDIDVKWVVFSFNVVILFLAGIATTLTGLLKIFGIDEDIKKLTKLVEKLDNQWFIFETEMNISPEERQNAADFIKRMDGNYMHSMQLCPHISLETYLKEEEKYTKRENGLIYVK